ncbi:MAG: ubiquinol-cytochrome c reductase iron-sulfur subunit [Candidatus Limnocylindria bacterium]
MSSHPTYGEIQGPPIGEMTRRTFMRRVLGVGVGILSLEFLAGTVNFLWPNVREGLGGRLAVGSAADIALQQAEWVNGLPYIFQSRIFIVNVPAAKARVEGGGTPGQPVPDPGTEVAVDIPATDRSVLALYRKCPHLGCQVPQLCDQSQWFECLCHGSKYTVLGEKRDGPAPRGMDRFTLEVENGIYYVNSGELEDGPPIGTETFDTRGPTEMPHCAG